jgi:hypothetical protein
MSDLFLDSVIRGRYPSQYGWCLEHHANFQINEECPQCSGVHLVSIENSHDKTSPATPCNTEADSKRVIKTP